MTTSQPRPSPLRGVLQVSAFFRKDALDIVRQPRLLLTLVLGPFLILLAFGLGYRDRTEPFRAWFVTQPGGPLMERLERDSGEIGRYMSIAGTGTDEADAVHRLRDGDVDVVVVLPADPDATIRDGRQAEVIVLHDRLDPIELAGVTFAARLAVGEMNAAVVAGVIEQGQDEAGVVGGLVGQASDAVAQAQAVVAVGGDAAPAMAELGRSMDVLDVGLGAGLAATQLARLDGGAGSQDDAATTLAQLRQRYDAVRNSAGPGGAPTPDSLAELEADLDELGSRLDALAVMDPIVVAHPFDSTVRSVVPGDRNLTDFYAPAAIALLVQQFGVAFGALSFVRERQLGVVELFRAGPMGAAPALIGKYLAYLAVGGLVAATLTALVVNLLSVPVGAGLGWLVVALGTTLLASIGLGFVISLASSSDTQAVQYTLIALLASLFFSGFFLTLDQLTYPAKVLSWLLPATFGITMLRDSMLLVTKPDRRDVTALLAYGLVAFVLALAGARRRLAIER